MRAILPLTLLLAGCAAGPGPAPGEGAVWHGGGLEPLRKYLELYKEDGEDRRRWVEELWDYGAGLLRRRYRDLEGRLIAEESDPHLVPSASERELGIAFALVRAHPALAPSARPAEAEWFGGFAFREPGDPHCGERSRCVHVMVTVEGGRRKLIHAIVDLQRGQVAHPFYDRATSRPVTPEDPYPESRP